MISILLYTSCANPPYKTAFWELILTSVAPSRALGFIYDY